MRLNIRMRNYESQKNFILDVLMQDILFNFKTKPQFIVYNNICLCMILNFVNTCNNSLFSTAIDFVHWIYRSRRTIGVSSVVDTAASQIRTSISSVVDPEREVENHGGLLKEQHVPGPPHPCPSHNGSSGKY